MRMLTFIFVVAATICFQPKCFAQKISPKAGQPNAATQPAIDLLSLMQPGERSACGVDKLTKEQQDALNKWMIKTYMIMFQAPGAQAGAARNQEDTQLFDGAGNPTAILAADDDRTIYLWHGKPVAYLDDDSIVGFNGKRIGWFERGKIYDVDGELIGATADQFRTPPTVTSLPGLKELKPLKMLKELKPLKPTFMPAWSSKHTLSKVLNEGSS